MAQRTSREVVDVGSRLPSGTARLDLSPAMLRHGSTPTSDREVPLSQGRTVLYATRPKTPARLIRATRSRQHHKHLKSTDMLERLNEEIRRRTHVVRIFPNGDSCLRLVRALAVETHENWLEQHRYLNMDDSHEHKKEALRRAA